MPNCVFCSPICLSIISENKYDDNTVGNLDSQTPVLIVANAVLDMQLLIETYIAIVD